MLVNFVIVQAAPGGPVDQVIAQLRRRAGGALRAHQRRRRRATRRQRPRRRAARAASIPHLIKSSSTSSASTSRAGERFCPDDRQLSALRFRQQLLQRPAASSASSRDKLPVSISLGLWTTLLVYLISIPLGIRKAVRDGSALRCLDQRASSSSAMPSRASCSPSC